MKWRRLAVCTVGVVLALLLGGLSVYQILSAAVGTNPGQESLSKVVLATNPLFDRGAFIAKVKEIFKPIEAVLPKDDTLDYDRTVLFSGLPNNTNEHIVIVPVSNSSASRQKAQRLGLDLTWKEANPITLAAYYIIPPNDFSSLEAGKPYLTMAISWDKRVVIDQTGAVVKEAEIMWLRGCNEKTDTDHDHVFGWMGKEWFLFLGNGIWHGLFCEIISEDQAPKPKR